MNENKTKITSARHQALLQYAKLEGFVFFSGKSATVELIPSVSGTDPNSQLLYGKSPDIFAGQTVPIGELLTAIMQLIETHCDRCHALSSQSIEFENEKVRSLTATHTELVQAQFAHLSDLIKYLTTCRSRDVSYSRFSLLLTALGPPPRRESLTDQDHELLDSFFSRMYPDVPSRSAPAHWAAFRQYFLQTDIAVCSSYYCNCLWDFCYAALDYLVVQGYSLRQCQTCGHYFIPSRDGREKYCSTKCANAMIVSKMSIKRGSPLYREIEAIQRMLAARVSKIESSLVGKSYADDKQLHAVEDTRKKLKNLVEDKQAELDAGITTEDDVLAFFIDYHNQLKDQLKEQRKHIH